MSVSNDGSESVDQFLARIASIKEGKNEPNAASRRMDEEFLKGRQERQARRLERARSISPSKTGPARPLSLSSNIFDSTPASEQALNPPVNFSPQVQPLSRTNAVSGRTSPVKELESESSQSISLASRNDVAQSTTAGLARSGTLSWQQRPAQRDGPRQRPLSGVASFRSISKEPEDNEQITELSRTEIAASLASKDPTWFRQTQDRAVGSAAFRKSQVEEVSEPLSSRGMQLPGMTRSREPSKSPMPETRDEMEPIPQKSIVNKDAYRSTRGATPDIVAMRESMAEKPSSLRPSSQDTFNSRPTSTDTLGLDDSATSLARSSSTLTHNRPPSPTKGLGGFVESAMMKRSDSVNKRWSVKSNTGLARGDSVAGARPRSIHSRGLSRDVPTMRNETPSSPLASSRPGSGHGRPSDLSPQATKRVERSRGDVSPTRELAELDVNNDVSTDSRPQTPTDETLARSPSKTMDSRRWSPTKSTWLETALQQQTEPPKLQPMKEEQPKWKLDLQRSKSRAGRDISPEKLPTGPEPVAASPKTTKALYSELSVKPGRPVPTVKPQETEEPQPKQTTVSTDDKPSVQSKSVVSPEPAKTVESEQRADTQPKSAPGPLKQAPVLRPKPQTPPKTDFRATLKSRSSGSAQNPNTEPEFRAVFGKLKRTTTQNYVAPDELKTNILTGKAALNTTGGPVKAKRVDEFKESILAKKEVMKAVAPKSVPTTESKTKMEEPMPEALARRKTLSKASAPDLSSLRKKPEVKPEVPAMPTIVKKLSTGKSVEAIPTPATMVEPAKMSPIRKPFQPIQDSKVSTIPADNSNQLSSSPDQNLDTTAMLSKTKSLPTVLRPTQKQPAAEPIVSETRQEPEILSIPAFPKPPAATTMPATGKLASRLNPNLAVLLSRGPSPKPPSTSNRETDSVKSSAQSNSQVGSSTDDAGLTHMTKGRARGPKRRAPKAETATQSALLATDLEKVVDSGSSSVKDSKPVATSPKSVRVWKPTVTGVNATRTQAPSALKELQQPKTPSKQVLSDPVSEEKDTVSEKEQKSPARSEKPKPTIMSKSPELARKVSSQTTAMTRLVSDAKPATPPKPSAAFATPNLGAAPDSKEIPPFKPSKAAMAPLPTRPPRNEEPSEVNVRPVASKPKPAIVQGLGVKMSPSPQAVKTATPTRELTPSPEEDLYVRHTTGSKDIKPMLEGYLGSLPSEHERADFDSQLFLAGILQDQDKIKTVQHDIVEVSGDGKKSSLPSDQQHILYEEAMYLTTHKFSMQGGSATSEVQLWCGDRVSDAAVEDAQIFCRRTAREHSVKLEVVRQGKESYKFISGLGGILITRRSKSAALYMLCGRRHLGHIVFDEVDMMSKNLCPGFAYLLSAPYGKFYLWKGRGAGVDEISSARLIGNDLGLTGEIEEIEDGREPSSFWDVVGKSAPSEYSRDWQNRASGFGNPVALYRIDHERPGMLTNLASWSLKRAASPAKQQVKATCEHIQPFTQNDLDYPGIHILDAYHTLYIIVTRQCAAKAAEFITSMYLAQDFAMLSPAIQDRSKLPVCYVVAGEPPQDVKTCFRKWGNIEGSSFSGKGSMCVRLEEVMEAVDL